MKPPAFHMKKIVCMESEINYEWFQNYLPGHEIELYIQNEHLFGSNSNRIVEVSINDSCIYKK